MPRGSGTRSPAGALPLADGHPARHGQFNRILEVDYDNRCMRVQPGVNNLRITKAVEADGLHNYAPDPSSQIILLDRRPTSPENFRRRDTAVKYGLTTNNVLGIEMVLIDGSVTRWAASTWRPRLRPPGLDDRVGRLLGVVTEVTVRLLPARPRRGRC